MSPATRVGLIGARRERQGLGPFVARELCTSGAEIACLLGTRQSTVDAARRDLAALCGVEPRGYTDLEAMLAGERLDALAVLCPSEVHETYLRAALDAGLHVLCEKPLVWGGGDLAVRGAALVEAFGERGLLLAANCQWPHALPAFRALHPESLGQRPERFEMLLEPISDGATRIGDAMPHPLSLLQCLAPDREAFLEHFRFEAEAGGIVVNFNYVAASDRIACRVHLRRGEREPREAGFAINGRWARRVVRQPGYALYFRSGDREVYVKDPLQSLIEAFMAELGSVLGGRKPAAAVQISSRMRMLESVLRAFEGETVDPLHP